MTFERARFRPRENTPLDGRVNYLSYLGLVRLPLHSNWMSYVFWSVFFLLFKFLFLISAAKPNCKPRPKLRRRMTLT